MAFKIYTRTGDLGKTSLIGGRKVPKNHIRIEAYGTVDELNSYVGLVADLVQDDISVTVLREIQDRLFTIGSLLATDSEKTVKMKLPDLHEEDILFLEKEIDRMSANLPEMKSFILPGGHSTVSSIHIARCVCRRAERLCVHMMEEEIEVDPLVVKYLNRLSDYLFMLARFTGHTLGAHEIPWRARIT